MAGGKETPRQKLIGMMYLVLLALLALQVGAEIMTKFAQLNDSLEIFLKESQKKSSAVLANIAEKVGERGNKPKEVSALTEAQKLHTASVELIKYIEDIKQELIEKTDGRDPETGAYVGMKNADVPSALMIGEGGKKDGKGYELKKKLDDYIDYLNKVYVDVDKAVGGEGKDTKHYEYMAHDGKDDPLLSKLEGNKNKDFAVLNFDHTPMIASLAFLTEKQSKIATYEGEILAKISSVVGASDFKFDVLSAMVRAESKVIAAGTKYKAEMFISATSSSITPTMKSSVGPVKMKPGGIGEIEFKASSAGGSFDKDGMMKKTWRGDITLPSPTGGDTTISFTEEYYISKPVIQVQSASVSALYKNCGNELNIQVPALGSLYNPDFAVSGARMQKGKDKGLITVIPSDPQVKITVRNDGSEIGTETFKVRLVPIPTIEARSRGKELDQKRGMPAPGPRSIDMIAVPDASFKEFLPKDARYRVTKWEALLVRGKRPVAKQEFSSPEGNLASFASQAQPGDRILIEVKEVIRRNYLDQNETVNLGTIIMNVPLTD